MPNTIRVHNPKPELPPQKVNFICLENHVSFQVFPSADKATHLNVHPLLLVEGYQLLH